MITKSGIVLSPKSLLHCTSRGQCVIRSSIKQNWRWRLPSFPELHALWMKLAFCFSWRWTVGEAGRRVEGTGENLDISPLNPSFINSTQYMLVQPLWLGYHGNQMAAITMAAAVFGGGTVPAWMCHRRAKQEPFQTQAHSCHGVPDSGPNSGTSDALSHSGTGVVGVGGVEEMLLVVVVRSRYQ